MLYLRRAQPPSYHFLNPDFGIKTYNDHFHHFGFAGLIFSSVVLLRGGSIANLIILSFFTETSLAYLSLKPTCYVFYCPCNDSLFVYVWHEAFGGNPIIQLVHQI